jgi:K+-sensing histidine kinase KdpD
LDIAARINTIRDQLVGDPPKPEPTDVAPVVQEAVDAAQESEPDAEFTVEGPETLRAKAHPTLGEAIDALIDVLIDHNDRERPRVSISLRPASDSAEPHPVLQVTDNGSGLPEEELIPIRAEDEPSAVRHAVNIDLWVANWLVTQFGGVLRAHERSENGVVLEIELESAPGD